MAAEELSKEKLQQLKQNLAELLAMDRYTVVSRYPFIGGILMHLNLIPVRDVNCSTACTDGKNVFVDIAFYSGLKPSERVFVLAHETWHCVLLHIFRREGREHQLWNVAIDMEANNIIKNSAPDSTFHPPTGALFPPPHLMDHSAEEIYNYLLSHQKQNNNNQSNQSSNSNDNNQQSGSGSGNSKQSLDGQFDDHQYSDNSGDNNKFSKKLSKDKYGERGEDPDFRPNPNPSNCDEIRDAVIAEAQKIEKNQGSIPGSLKKIIDQYRTKEIKWQEELAKFTTTTLGDHRRWLPPQRRHVYNEMYFQSRRSETIDVVVAIDTSGSCTDALPKFFTELISLIETFGDYKLMVIQCDSEVSKVDEYDSASGQKFDPHASLEMSGGGGTSFEPPFKYLKEQGITPNCFIYFTDGYGNAPQMAPSYPVLWILTSDCNENFCNWGRKIKFKSEQ